jgi:arabinan endo-1,5-alpha-L-arabinosidase
MSSPKIPRLLRAASLALIVLAVLIVVVARSDWERQTVETAGGRVPTGWPRPASPGPSLPSRPEASTTGDIVTAIRRLEGVNAPDPFVVMHNGRAWLFATNMQGSNVPLIAPDGDGSTTMTDALPVLPEWAVPGYTWAPAVTAVDDGWVLAFTARHRASGLQCIGVATATDIAGPYEAAAGPLVCDVWAGGSIDPSFVEDDQGHRWLLYKDDGNCCDLPTALRAVPLTADGTALAGPSVVLVQADRPWEDGVVEAPTMVQVGDRWLLLYSASRWDDASYAVGAAWCTSPVGPCVKQPDPVLSIGEGYDGPGGLELVVERTTSGAGVDIDTLSGVDRGVPVVFHAWPDRPHGSEDGSERQLHVGVIVADGDRLVIGTRR